MNAKFEKILGQCAAYAALLWYISLLVFPIGWILVLVVACMAQVSLVHAESAGATSFAIAALMMAPGLLACLLLTIVVLAVGPNQMRMRVLWTLGMYGLFFAIAVANDRRPYGAPVIGTVLGIAVYGVMGVTLVMAVRWIACWRQDRVAGKFIRRES